MKRLIPFIPAILSAINALLVFAGAYVILTKDPHSYWLPGCLFIIVLMALGVYIHELNKVV
jgi:hypothetical protein